MPQKENRTALLARQENTYGVDSIAPALLATPSAYLTDAMLVSNLDIATNADALERPNYSPSLSKDATGIGRVTAQLTFQTEYRASGVVGVAPRIGRLMKACGMQETVIPAGAGSQIGNPSAGPLNASAPIAAIIAGLSKTAAPTKCFDYYRVTVTTGGAPAAAKFLVTGAGFPDNDTVTLNSTIHSYATSSILGTVVVSGPIADPVFTFAGTFVANDFVEIFVGGVRFYYQVAQGDTVTTIATAFKTLLLADGRFTGTANAAGVLTVNLTAATDEIASTATAQVITLGQSGAQITIPVWTGTLVAGEYFEVFLRRAAVRYDPISDASSSVSFYIFLDGSLYRMYGARGTFTIEGAAATYPMMSWTFTGIYVDPVDMPLPTNLVFEQSKPWKVELSQLAVYGLPSAVASRFSFDAGNEVTIKDNINASEAYDEISITDRTPTAGCDPEAVKPSVFSPWARMRREDQTKFGVAVGVRGGAGNLIYLTARRASYTGAPFANRNKIRAHNYGFRLARVSGVGDDEYSFEFA